MHNRYNLDKDAWVNKLNNVMSKFGLAPNDYSKYLIAFTHSSFKYENNLTYNYERFEFLGDSAISWIICKFLFNDSELDEGSMSIKKARLVSCEILSNATKLLTIDELILVGNGLEEISNKILEDVFESFIGAITNDLGIEAAEQIVDYCIIQPYLNGKINVSKPYKTLIQEALMRSNSNEIQYIPISSKNPNLKTVKLVFDKNIYGIGSGATLKIAEEAAAKDAYNKLNKS